MPLSMSLNPQTQPLSPPPARVPRSLRAPRLLVVSRSLPRPGGGPTARRAHQLLNAAIALGETTCVALADDRLNLIEWQDLVARCRLTIVPKPFWPAGREAALYDATRQQIDTPLQVTDGLDASSRSFDMVIADRAEMLTAVAVLLPAAVRVFDAAASRRLPTPHPRAAAPHAVLTPARRERAAGRRVRRRHAVTPWPQPIAASGVGDLMQALASLIHPAESPAEFDAATDAAPMPLATPVDPPLRRAA